MDEETAVEFLPLQPRVSFNTSSTAKNRLARSSSTESSSPSWDIGTSSRPLVQQALCSILFGLFGWNFPRYLISIETTIQHNVPPFQKTQAGDVILDFLLNQNLTYPPTVGSSLLIWGSIWIPLVLVVMAAWSFAPHRPAHVRWHDVHASFCGLITAVGLSEGATVLLKLYIQRRRPNFYALCGFDKQLLQCTADLEKIREASFSFPSGHSSLASCGMTFLVWFFLGKILLSRWNRSSTRILCTGACVLPWGWAAFVGASRLVDQWHHPSDVLAGLLLGGLSSTIVYHIWYHPTWSDAAGHPWSLQPNERKL
jgi:membrane-associated phospholipid phosphatase